MRTAIIGAVVAVLLLCGQAGASMLPDHPYFVVDEYGNGFVRPFPAFDFYSFVGELTPDPSGGLTQSVLVYGISLLPTGGTPGDVVIFEPQGTVASDIIRFTGNGQMIFYSDGADGLDEPADVPQFPYSLPNVAFSEEVGPEGANYAIYTPLEGQPGWDPSNPTYKFVSDGQSPEPATLLLLALGGLALLRRKHA
ncbi:MAG: PEP-CTERM sorting domain-containing protein [Planctomycetota bacterium]|nr:PEP-CTERM sorting domain-containing protein [Planctomycetota bacterium]